MLKRTRTLPILVKTTAVRQKEVLPAKMSVVLNYALVLIFSALLNACYSMPHNETNINNGTAKKRSTVLSAVSSLLTGTKSSVDFVDTVYDFFKKAVMECGTITVNIWNQMPADLDDARWKTENLELEAPPPFVAAARSSDPVKAIAHYTKYVAFNGVRKFWINYRIPAIVHRVCICAEIGMSGIISQSHSFKYAIYVTRLTTCDNPVDDIFVTANVDNGYEANWDQIQAKAAFTSNKLSYALNVYISGYSNELNEQQQDDMGNLANQEPLDENPLNQNPLQNLVNGNPLNQNSEQNPLGGNSLNQNSEQNLVGGNSLNQNPLKNPDIGNSLSQNSEQTDNENALKQNPDQNPLQQNTEDSSLNQNPEQNPLRQPLEEQGAGGNANTNVDLKPHRLDKQARKLNEIPRVEKIKHKSGRKRSGPRA